MGPREMKDCGIEWLGEIPDTWKIQKISSFYSLRSQKVSDKDYEPLSVTMKGILPQLENVAKTDNGNNRKLVRKGDFVINSRSDRRGACGISSYDGSVSVINNVLTPFGETEPRYFNWLFHTENFADEFYKWGNGIVDDLWSTRWQEMKKISIPVPPLKEQTAIADFLDSKCSEIDALTSDIEKHIETLQEYKKSVITEAVTKGLNPNVEMKDSGIEWIGEIPKHWKVSSIGKAYDVVLGKMLCNEQKHPFATYEKYLCAGSISWEGIRSNYVKKMWFNPVEKQRLEIKKNDVLVVEGGAGYGTTAIYKSEIPSTCYFQNSINRIRTNGLNSSRFVKYWMHLVYIGYLPVICNETTFAHYTREKLRATPIALPPNDEQIKISEHLDALCAKVDDVIRKKSIQLEVLSRFKQALIYEYVTGKKTVPNS